MSTTAPTRAETPDFTIESLGEATLPSPIQLHGQRTFSNDSDRILIRPYLPPPIHDPASDPTHTAFEVAGPRARIYFDPVQARAGIVTCGGLCPGLNAVIRGLVLQLWHRYGVRHIVGVPYGYQGLSQAELGSIRTLDPQSVVSIHHQGGTILGSSRGTPPTTEICDSIEHLGLHMLFVIGGDGTMRGARAICEEMAKRGRKISVIGIPKTIDNDIPFVRRSFGFESAVEAACRAVDAAHEEARGARNGIGLVKLMGRHSGYVAAYAALATGDVNFCLIPEAPFALEGPDGLLELVARRLEQARHAVIAVAEGAGQHFFSGQPEARDPSGNTRLGDIGTFLRGRLEEHLTKRNMPFTLKYIDPSYIIRSTPANAGDRMFCAHLAQNAVHAAMAGKTGMLIGFWHGKMTHIPFSAIQSRRQQINPDGELWFNVLETTGQPSHIGA